jgi:hypothetical protein
VTGLLLKGLARIIIMLEDNLYTDKRIRGPKAPYLFVIVMQ